MNTKAVNKAPITGSGKLLWQLLPDVYRNWDGTFGKDPRQPNKELKQRGDLANYLDAYGVVLDQVKNTILQRLADTSPETCQDWLIPYFADLLDVHLVSPDIDGQRQEVARAISWRQRKGTIGCSSEIAQEVGRYEEIVLTKAMGTQSVASYQTLPTVMIHEGFRRVATTVRIGLPLASLYSLGIIPDEFNEDDGKESPIHNARRPGLPAGTVDFRFLSRAQEITRQTPVSHSHAFNGEGVHWQQKDTRGIPSYADSYQDTSVRTVDVRSASWNKGHYHPNRTLVYTKPREGFFSPGQFKIDWVLLNAWYKLFDTTGTQDKPFIDKEDEKGDFQERVLDQIENAGQTIILIQRLRTTSAGGEQQRLIGLKINENDLILSHRVEIVGEEIFYLQTGFEINEQAIVADVCGYFSFSGFGEYTALILSHETVNLMELSSANINQVENYLIEDVVINAELNLDAPVNLSQSAVKSLSVTVNSLIEENNEPALNATDSLMDSINVQGLCQLEYCTVLENLSCTNLQASDCILLDKDNINTLTKIYLRYSAVPYLLAGNIAEERGRIYEETMSRSNPLFMHDEHNFGEPGYAVLHPVCESSIRQGAEDGGEMGAYHHRHYVLREQATLDKLKEFLPVTQQPVLIVHSDWSSPCSYQED